jgi:TP901 family phage tail tape measure protein
MPEITQKLGFDAAGAISQLDKLTRGLKESSAALRAMQGATSKGAAALKKTDKSLKNTKNRANELTLSWKTMLRVVQTQVVVRGLNIMVQQLKEAVSTALELGLAIEEVRTIDTARRTAEDIRTQILAVSDAIGQSSQDLAEGLYQTLSNQVVEAGEAFEFLAESAKLAKVTSATTGDAVNALSSVMNSYEKDVSELAHVSDTLFKTIELGRVRLGEIADIIGRVTPLTARLGITWEETAASIAVMTRQGVRADTSLTQLRAVVTRLIKPTDEIRAIFRKWGVEDGKQAIQTFGGLTGVLKKLMTETGESSAEMADLLRNVRAISGAFGIMTGNGEQMTEALDAITNSAGAASGAWEQFAASDAQELTRNIEEFKNQLTAIGSSSLPIIIVGMEVINSIVEDTVVLAKQLSGNWDESDFSALKYADTVKRIVKEEKGLRDLLAERSRGAFDSLITASNKYYANANKQEFLLQDIRDSGVASATASLESAIKAVSDVYTDSLSKMNAFISKADSNIASGIRKIADIDETLHDRAFKRKLSDAKTLLAKQRVLEQELHTQRREQAEKLAAIDTTEESLKAFEKLNKRVVDLAEQRLALAKTQGVRGTELSRIEGEVVKQIAAGQAAQRKFVASTREAQAAVKGESLVVKELQSRLSAVNKETSALFKDGKLTEDEQAQFKALQEERKKLNEELKKSGELLRDFGLDIEFDAIVDNLTDALNSAKKDWVAEVDVLEAELASRRFAIRFALDPQGISQRAGEALGIQRLPTDTIATQQRKVAEATQKALADEQNRKEDIIAKETSIGKLLQANKATILDAAIATKSRLAALREEARLGGRTTEVKGAEGLFGANILRESSAQRLADVREALKLDTEIASVDKSIILTLKSEREVSQETLGYRESLLRIARENPAIASETLKFYIQQAKQLNEAAGLQTELAALRKETKPQEEVQALEALLELNNQRLAGSKTESQLEGEIANKQARAAEFKRQLVLQSSNAKAAADALNQSETNVSNSVGTAVGNTNALTRATEGTVLAVNALADAYRRVADAVAGGGTPGELTAQPRAAGGMLTRGTDTQLTALSPGENVTNARSSRKFFSELNAINQDSKPVFRAQGGSVTNVGDVNVTVNGGDSSQQTIREIGHGLRRQIQRGTIRLR